MDGRGLRHGARGRRRTPIGDYRQEKQLLLSFRLALLSRCSLVDGYCVTMIWFKPNVPPRPEGQAKAGARALLSFRQAAERRSSLLLLRCQCRRAGCARCRRVHGARRRRGALSNLPRGSHSTSHLEFVPRRRSRRRPVLRNGSRTFGCDPEWAPRHRIRRSRKLRSIRPRRCR